METERQSDPLAEHESEEDIFAPEVSDLRPARPTQRRFTLGSFWSAHTLTGQRLSRRQRFVRGGSIALAVVLVLVVLVFSMPANPIARLFARRPTLPLVLHLESAGALGCIVTAAWSPDSARIALLGSTSANCSTYGGPSAQINLYDARSGNPLDQVSLNPTVRRALAIALPGGASALPSDARYTGQQIQYGALLWSRDGRRIIMSFTIFASVVLPASHASPASQQTIPVYGVLLLDTRTGQVRTLLDVGKTAQDQEPLPEWDLVHGRPLSSSDDIGRTGQYGATKQPQPIVAYHWGTDGALIPDMTQPDVAITQPGAIGDPDGAASFTIWQSGTLSTQQLQDNQLMPLPAYFYFWEVAISALSPDGRYLASVPYFAPLPLERPQNIQVKPALLGQQFLPVRDAALRQVLTRDPIAQQGYWSLAWRPDGRLLAVSDMVGKVDLFSCTNGRVLATLTPPPFNGNTYTPSPKSDALLWSPDGSHLALYSTSENTVTIWGPDLLPR